MENRPVPYKTGEEVEEEELGGWRNLYEDVYENLVGEEKLLEKIEEQYEDVFDDDDGLLSGLGSKFKRVKLDLFPSVRLSYPHLESKPRPVGGVGFLNIVRNPKFPQNDFFHPGRVFCVRIRHNNLAFSDDTCLDWKVACLKLADQDVGGPLDLVLHTGRSPPYYNSETFDSFVDAFKSGEDDLKEWGTQRPVNLQGLIEGSRRCPRSFHDQRYYSHMTYELAGKDNKHYLARLRLLPLNDVPETGLPNRTDQMLIWRRHKRVDERREPDYLRKQYTRSLSLEPLQYQLQIQTVPYEPDKPSLCNSCLLWNQKRSPWEDLGLLTVSLSLPEEVLVKTRIDILTNQHSCFKPVQPRSTKSFASLTLVLREFHGLASQPHTPEKHRENKDCSYNSVQYLIEVKTGSSLNAGTDGDVYITLTGDKGRSLPVYLDNKFYDDFEPGSADKFDVSARDVGELINITMELRSVLPNRQWHLEHVKVVRVGTGVEKVFPCYRWLSASQPIVVVREATVLPQEETQSFALLRRKYDLEERRREFQWQHVDGLPAIIKTSIYQHLPKDAKLQIEKELDLMEGYLKTLAATGASSVITFLEPEWDIFKDCEKLLSKLLKENEQDTPKKIAEAWQSDEEFGRQFLNGPHPVLIRKATTLPLEFSSDWTLPEELVERDGNLTKAIENNHIFMVEYPDLQTLNPQVDHKGKYNIYLTSPKCLFYVRHDGHLVPIAISLQSLNQVKIPARAQNDADYSVWTPNDDPNDWLLAKMWVKMADAQYHHVVSYHLHCLLVLEVFAVAMFRNLASVHPVYKLIHPHLSRVIAVNVLGRQHLHPGHDGMFERFLSVGKQYKKLLKVAYRDFSLDTLHLPTDLKERGVDNKNELPHYYYRNDALKLWEIVKKYVRTVLYLHYWKSKTLETDDELQAWANDMSEYGFKSAKRENGCHGVPSRLRTLDEVIELVTIVIFTASCRSSALTSGIMDYYGIYPNYPTMMLQPPPNKRQTSIKATLLESMPSRTKTAEILAALYTLTNPGREHVSLGEYHEHMFGTEALKVTVSALHEDLERLTKEIEERNEKLSIPYNYLLPKNITNSVSM